ncbi:MAG: histidine kinase [Chthoniobacterales bacterium]
MAPVLQGFGTALILAIVEQVRDRDEQARAAASAEVRALQARMNPHFLFNALNALAALATVAPREIPRAAGRLRHFLRASFDQQERAFVPIEEELGVVRAYLDIESLRFGSRLKVEEAIDTGLTATADGFGRQRTSLGQLLGLLYHLLFAVGNSHRQMSFALELADLLDHSCSLLDELNNALVKRINLLAIRRKLFLGTRLCF